MSDSRDVRLGQVAALLSVLPAAWPLLRPELERIRAEKVEQLVVANSEELRGGIKFIDELLRLPNTLHQEMQDLAQPLPE